MAVPALPNTSTIATEGLKRGGRTNPSASQITDAINHALQEVKADIMAIAPTHPALQVTATTVTTRGQQRYGVPGDYNIPVSISMMNGPENWKGTAAGATSTSITLASSMSAVDDDLAGKYILITSGTGIEEYRQILFYNPSTRVATVDVAWSSSPVSSTYAIINTYNKLWPLGTYDYDLINAPTLLGYPSHAVIYNQEYVLTPTPDKSTYGIMVRYYADLSLVDESGNLFTQLLREWRNVWIQGIAVKTMQRYDEDRYAKELEVYAAMLGPLAQEASGLTQIQFFNA